MVEIEISKDDYAALMVNLSLLCQQYFSLAMRYMYELDDKEKANKLLDNVDSIDSLMERMESSKKSSIKKYV